MGESSVGEVVYFRPMRSGPERRIEDAVASNVTGLVSVRRTPLWMAGSLTIGAGMPDLLAVAWEPCVTALANPALADSSLLAYLRAVGPARLDTIVTRLRRSSRSVSEMLEALVEAAVIRRRNDVFDLAPVWKAVLPEVIAVEAKVADWRRALAQAARNQIFAHRSFVALPEKVANRVYEDQMFKVTGVGVLSVGSAGTVEVLRRAAARRPRVWAYYYQLAHEVARNTTSTTECRSSSQSSRRGNSIPSMSL